jgi:hypothetical protein
MIHVIPLVLKLESELDTSGGLHGQKWIVVLIPLGTDDYSFNTHVVLILMWF